MFRHNEDGSYTYGYEGSDGSFKLETRFPDGRVQGRYGYVDIDTGKLKVIEYGADAMGFQVMPNFLKDCFRKCPQLKWKLKNSTALEAMTFSNLDCLSFISEVCLKMSPWKVCTF